LHTEFQQIKTMRKIILNLFLIIILLGSFLVRFYKIDNPVADWHSWRQADTASVTRIYTQKGIDLLHPKYHDFSYLQTGVFNPEGYRFVEFPIFNAIHASLVKVFPQYSLEKWGRLLSVICSLVSTFLMFQLGKRFLGKWTGLLSAGLFAFLPFNVYFSRVILPEPMAVMFVLLSLVFFTKWFDTNKKIPIYISAIAFSLALLVKPYAIFYGIPIFWLALVKHKYQLSEVFKNKLLWIFGLIVLIPIIAWRFWMAQFPEGIPFYKWVFNLEGIRFKPSFWRWIFGERLSEMILGNLSLIPFVAGLISKPKKEEIGFTMSMGIAAFSYVSVIAAANVRHDYYQTLIIPSIVLIVAKGAWVLWNSKEFYQPFTKLIVLIALIGGIYFSWNNGIRDFYQINHPEILRAGEAVDKIAAPDALVVAPYNGDTAFLYQTKRSGWPYQGQPVEELVQLGADYYVSVNLNDPQTQDAMRKFEIPIQTDEYVIIDLNRKRMPKN